MAQAPRVDVPTMEQFNTLQAQVDDHEKRITALENGGDGEEVHPSPDGTQVTDENGYIVDNELREFKLVASAARAVGYRISMDGGEPTGAGVIRLYADQGLCYQENTDHDWWYMGTDDWVSAADPTGEVQPPQPSGDTLFADEFDGDLSLWNAYQPDGSKTWQLSRWYGNDWFGWVCNEGWMINPFNPATPKSDMYRLDNGSLILDVQRTPTNMLGACGNKKFITAQVNSLTFKRKGGYWEARIKAPFIPGTNMAFWLMNNKSWPPEVDICELVNGGSWTLMSQGIWYAQADQGNEHYSLYGDQGFDIEAWHTYGFWWDADNKRMQMFYDGQKTMDQAEPAGYDEPMFVICGSQSGGDWSGPIPDNAQMAPLRFDYVRCYASPPSDAASMQLTTVGTRGKGRLRGKNAQPGAARGTAPGRMRGEAS